MRLIIIALCLITCSCGSKTVIKKGTVVSRFKLPDLIGDGVHYYFKLSGRDINNKQVETEVEVPDSDFNKYDILDVYYPMVEEKEEKNINDRR